MDEEAPLTAGLDWERDSRLAIRAARDTLAVAGGALAPAAVVVAGMEVVGDSAPVPLACVPLTWAPFVWVPFAAASPEGALDVVPLA